MLRKVILNIHTYGGLLCFSYLMILGISTLNFNHPFAFTKSPASVTTWNQPLVIGELKKTDGLDVAQRTPIEAENNRAIVRAIGSFAAVWPSTLSGKWVDADTYHLNFTRPGRIYQVDVHTNLGTATITQTRTSFWTIIRDLHGGYSIYPESPVASTWSWYTELSVFFVIGAIVSGIYLWLRRRRDRCAGLIVLAAASAMSLGVMALIIFQG